MSTRTSENDMIRVITYYIYIIYIIYIVNNADYTTIPREKQRKKKENTVIPQFSLKNNVKTLFSSK
jgi:hypothetical protein